MTLQHWYPLAFLLFLPAIVLLYLLKQKAKEQPVSSLYLWREAYQNRRSDTPWEKLKKNLLLYLQLLAMGLLVLAAAGPIITGKQEEHPYPILVLDCSASMGMAYEEETAEHPLTRLDVAKEEALRYVEGLGNSARITVVSVDETGTICISASDNRAAVEEAIQKVEQTTHAGDISSGNELYRSLAALYEDYQLIAFTDTPVDFGSLRGEWVDVANEVANCSVDMVSHRGMDVLVKVTNHAKQQSYHGDVSLYLEEELLEVQTVDIPVKESKILYFTLEEEIVEALGDKLETGALLRATISGRDALSADNEAQDVLQRQSGNRVLLVTEQNAFLEQALRANERWDVYKTNQLSEELSDGFDLYLYDGITPETLPEDGAVFLLHPETEKLEWLEEETAGLKARGDIVSSEGTNKTGGSTDVSKAAEGTSNVSGADSVEDTKALGGASSTEVSKVTGSADSSKDSRNKDGASSDENTNNAGGYLTFEDTDATTYVADYRIGFRSWQTFEMPEWGNSFLRDEDGNIVGFYGTREGQRLAVLGLDLHQGDFALQSQFPMFINSLCNTLLEQPLHREVSHFPVQESGVLPSTREVADVSLSGDGAQKQTGSHATAGRQEYGKALRIPLLCVVLALLAVITGIFLIRAWQEHRAKQDARATRATRGAAARDRLRRTIWSGIPLLRVAVVVLIILAMAGVTARIGGNGLTTVYLLDVSDSVAEQKAAGEAFIREAQAMEVPGQTGIKQNRSAVVAFGGTASVEQFLSEEGLFRAVGTNPVRSATNLEQAVQTGLALIPEEDVGQLVLLTDGGQTEGDITKLIRAVAERQVAVKVVSLGEKQSPESYISGLEVPADVQVGDSFLITVKVESNQRMPALLTLYEGGVTGEKQKAVREVELAPGTNQFAFTDTRTSEGMVTYRAVLESSADTRTVNNQYTAFTNAKAADRFLLIEAVRGDGAALQQVLAGSQVQVECRQAAQAPTNLMDLCAYAGVILVNTPVSAMPEKFLDSLQAYVRDYGGSLITTGGDRSYALGGYRDTVLETILPVNMDLRNETETPSVSMVYVIDKSGSMSNGSGSEQDKMSVAKSAAAEAAKNLRDIDRLGVIAFDDRYEWVLPMTPADDSDTIQTAIGGIQSGGGTSIYPALAAAAQALEPEESRLKHIILLSDGQDSFHAYKSLTSQMAELGITLSTVAVGDDADTYTLEHLAKEGNGRYYFADRLSALPDIFAQEVYLSMGEYLVNQEFVPAVSTTGEILSGVWENGLYPLLGYTAATEKDIATVYLRSDEGEPILSSLQYGLGKTVSWQSDVNGGWSAAYIGTPEFARLWRNLTDWVKTDLSDETGRFSVRKNGNHNQFVYEVEDYTAQTSVSMICTDQDGNRQEYDLIATSPGVYETSVELEESKAYSVFVVRKEGDEVVGGQVSGVANQYSLEYQFADRSGLERFMQALNAGELSAPSEVFEHLPEGGSNGQTKRSLTVLLLCLASILFFIDILLRRFDWHPARFVFGYLQRRWSGFAGKSIFRKKNQRGKNDFSDKDAAGKEIRYDGRDSYDRKNIHDKENYAKNQGNRHISKHKNNKNAENAQNSNLLNTQTLLQRKSERKQK